MVSDKKEVFVIILITTFLALYLLLLSWKFTPFIDAWPLEGIFWETVAVIAVISLLSYKLFNKITARLLIFLGIQAFLIVVLPVLKYPNALNIVGPWDSAAHYSFAKWIIVNGNVDTAGNLYYSDQYGYHPGNGIIPATLSLLSSVSLGWSMNNVLITVYIGYMLFLIALFDKLRHSTQGKKGLNDFLWLLTIFVLSISLLVHYSGVALGFIYSGGILYIFIRWMLKNDDTTARVLGLLLLIFLGLLSTHLFTSVIVVAYLLLIVVILLFSSILNKAIIVVRHSGKELILIPLIMISVFTVYEIYIDVLLSSDLLRSVIRTMLSLYIEEIETARTALEVRGLTFIELLQYLISIYAKNVNILGLIFIHTIILLIKWNLLNRDEKKLSLLLFASYPTWIIVWAGLGSFMAGVRALSIISFLLSVNLLLTYEKLYRFIVRKSWFVIPLALIVIGFVANFGLPFQPIIRSGEDTYIYAVLSQVGFSDLALHPISYAHIYASSSHFLCLQPYTGFGLCDLMWQTPKIPRHGSITPKINTPEAVIEIMKKYLDKQVIIPQPLRDKLMPGLIGYHSFYEKPFYFLIGSGKCLIYNNGMYTLFLV
jgi:hypothetical protein